MSFGLIDDWVPFNRNMFSGHMVEHRAGTVHLLLTFKHRLGALFSETAHLRRGANTGGGSLRVFAILAERSTPSWVSWRSRMST